MDNIQHATGPARATASNLSDGLMHFNFYRQCWGMISNISSYMNADVSPQVAGNYA